MCMTQRDRVVLNEIIGMDGGLFEQFVADLWRVQGWNVTVTQNSRDRGVDIIAEKSTPFSQKQVIQAKCNSRGNKITSPDVQQYNSLKDQIDGVDAVVIVTTSTFTSQAKQLASNLNVKIIDGPTVIELLSNVEGTGILEKYTLLESEGNRTESGDNRTVASASNLMRGIKKYLQYLDSGREPQLQLYLKNKEDYEFTVEYLNGEPEVTSIFYLKKMSPEKHEEVLDRINNTSDLYTVDKFSPTHNPSLPRFIWVDYENSSNWGDIDRIYTDIDRLLRMAYSIDVDNISKFELHHSI